MGVAYRHTQFGYLLVATLGLGIAGMSAAIILGNAPPAIGVAIAVLGLCLAMFPTLTTEVQADCVKCFFGVGVIRRRIALRDITSVAVVRNSWVHGWGMRLIPGGWLWTVSGLDAVELHLQNGSLFRIGTDEPAKLSTAITTALRAG